MKRTHQLLAAAALVFLVGCSQDQPMGGDKAVSPAALTNETQDANKAPATPPSTPTPAQPVSAPSGVTSNPPAAQPNNPPPAQPPAAPPGNNPPGSNP